MPGLVPGHPRLTRVDTSKTWMPGTSPGMTEKASKEITK